MEFSNLLTQWYSKNKRQLPWRLSTNPYKIWLSEVLLQQTQIIQGLPYYKAFISEFPTLKALAEADEERVLKLWQGLGYYSRARNLLTTAKHIQFELNGQFPNNFEGLLKLKGIGPYTAAAIASICFNEPVAVVDGNVYRVLSRYFNVTTPINSSGGQKEFKVLAQQMLDGNNPSNHNQAIMELGALVCKPNNPDCDACPLNNSCLALKYKSFNSLPVKLKKQPVKKRYFNYLVIRTQNEKTIIQKRTDKGIWLNMYQFPLIESDQPISEKTLKDHPNFKALFKSATAIEPILFNTEDIVTKLTHQHLFTKFWIIEIENHPLANIPLNELKKYPVPILIHNFLKAFKLT